MKRFAVAFVHLSDNELKVEVVQANDWLSALSKTSFMQDQDWLHEVPTVLEDAKQFFFDADMLLNVVEVIG